MSVQWGLFWAIWALSLPSNGQGTFRLGRSFDGEGQLVQIDTNFRMQSGKLVLAGQFSAPRRISVDTLFVFVKQGNQVVGRFFAKRSRNGLSANCFLAVKAPGMYRVVVYNPRDWSRLVAKARFYVTTAELPTPSAVIRQSYTTNKTAAPAIPAPASAPTAPAPTNPADDEDPLGGDTEMSDEVTSTEVNDVVDAELNDLTEPHMLNDLPDDLRVEEGEFQGDFQDSEKLEQEQRIDLDQL